MFKIQFTIFFYFMFQQKVARTVPHSSASTSRHGSRFASSCRTPCDVFTAWRQNRVEKCVERILFGSDGQPSSSADGDALQKHYQKTLILYILLLKKNKIVDSKNIMWHFIMLKLVFKTLQDVKNVNKRSKMQKNAVECLPKLNL